jgi:1-acyl-sn-glycerol-3-phosphate acyltransferase
VSAGSSETARRAAIDELAANARVPLHRRLLSTAFWVFITITSIAIFPLAALTWLVTLPFDPKKKVLHQLTCAWASFYVWLNPMWPVRILGREHIEKNVPYVMVANHLSLIDVLVLFRLFRHFKWVSKIENFRVPCIGWNMTLNGYIPLVRGDTRSIAVMMDACRVALNKGNPVMMFPEGTRSKDGRLRPFKLGAFRLASEMALPILPIVIEGTGNALPKAGFVLPPGKHPITIRVLPPIPPKSFEGLTAEQLMGRVRGIFLHELGES